MLGFQGLVPFHRQWSSQNLDFTNRVLCCKTNIFGIPTRWTSWSRTTFKIDNVATLNFWYLCFKTHHNWAILFSVQSNATGLCLKNGPFSSSLLGEGRTKLTHKKYISQCFPQTLPFCITWATSEWWGECDVLSETNFGHKRHRGLLKVFQLNHLDEE